MNIAVVWYLYVRALVVGGPSNHEPQTVFKIVMKHQKVKKQGGKLDTYLKKIEERKKKRLERARWNEIWREWSG